MDKKIKKIQPPRWADRLFEWYCHPDLQEEIQGDLYEMFMDKAEQGSLWQAQLWYWFNVILFFNRHTLQRGPKDFTHLNSIDMFRNYFKIGYRNILRNKLSTLINAAGMALAIGCALTVFIFLDHLYHLDTFHENLDEIYVVQRNVDYNGEVSVWNDSPEPIGFELKEQFSQVKEVVRVNHSSGVLKYGDKVFTEWVSFADPAYYDMFDFPVKWGDPATFKDRKGVVIEEHIAKKYFGTKQAIGETIDFRFTVDGKEFLEKLEVKGVLAKPPSNYSFSNQIIIPFEIQQQFYDDKKDWTRLTTNTFIQVNNERAITDLKNAEKEYLQLVNSQNLGWKLTGLHFQPLKTVAQYGHKTNNNPFHTATPVGIYMLVFIAVALLTLACFNYINIALAAGSTRLKEISIRKVLGGHRRQLITQFLTENLLICTLALVLGGILAEFLFLPWFAKLTTLEMHLDLLTNHRIWLFVVGLLLLTAVGGAGYPAVYISKFQPVAILKKEFRIGNKQFFRKLLIGTQLLFTLITLFATFAFMMATHDLKQKDRGYEQHDLLVIQLEKGADFPAFKNRLGSYSNIIEIAGSQEQIGRTPQQLEIKMEGETLAVEAFEVGSNYFSTFQIPLISGQSFHYQAEAGQQQSVVVNEAFLQQSGWEQAEGQELVINEKRYTVIGTTRDVYQADFFEQVKPTLYLAGKEDQFQYVTIRTTPGQLAALTQKLEQEWKAFYPHSPYSYFHQDSVFDGYFYGFNQVNALLSAASFLTIFVCIIGLFGLAMLLLTRRMKELSIRKVLGASFLNISYLVNKEFFIPLVVALLLGLPLSFVLVKAILSQISPDYIIGVLPFLLTILGLVLMLALSVSKPIYNAVVSEPTRYLKEE